jgi:uridine kinase
VTRPDPPQGATNRATSRAKVIGRIADHLAARDPGHPLRVAVDGISAAGKTTLADEVASAVRARGRPVVRLSMDNFHHLRARRHRQGRSFPLGYYQDAFDFDAFRRFVLTPLGPGGSRQYLARVHDLATDQPTHDQHRSAAGDAVVIADGSFLQNEQLDGLWDDVVYVDTSFAAARERGVARDAALLGGVAQAGDLYDARYHAAARLYLDEVHPAEQASIHLSNDNLDTPGLLHIGGPADATVSLFSYGTLQQTGVQRASFGRTLMGRPDTLPGHRLDWVTITDPAVIAASGTDRHPLVRPTGEARDQVPGTVLILSTAELAAADLYEVDDYRRHHVQLSSGHQSWVYRAIEA